MKVTIAGVNINTFTNLQVTTRFDSLVSDFSFSARFLPNDRQSRELFRPYSYHPVTISEGNRRLLTGIAVNHVFNDGETESLVQVSGHTKCGVLETANVEYGKPVQFDTSNLKNIAVKLLQPFGLNLSIDKSVQDVVNSDYNTTALNDNMTIKDYLSTLASQKNIVLTHDAYGNVLFTRVRFGQYTTGEKTLSLDYTTSGAIPASADLGIDENYFSALSDVVREYRPVAHFERGAPGVSMSFGCNGQSMHSDITVVRQTDSATGSPVKIANPYRANYCPSVERQTSSNTFDTRPAARMALGSELKGITLTIQLSSWYANGRLMVPNSIVTVKNEYLSIFNSTAFFVESVTYSGDEAAQTATLTCVLPQVYTIDEVKNIFL